MFDAGVDGQLGELVGSVRSLAAEVEFDRLEAHEAARVVELCAEAERLLAALRVLATATLEDKALWRREGFRSAAVWMAAKTGTHVGTAIATMEMAALLTNLPVVAEAFDPVNCQRRKRERSLRRPPRPPMPRNSWSRRSGNCRCEQEECRRVEAAAARDQDDRYRRVHRGRCVRSWIDRHGVGHMSARGTPDEVARLMTEVDRRCDDMVANAIQGRWFEGRDAHRFDALIDLARPASAAPAGPDSMIHVVVDYDALMRGHTVAGEQCEIPGSGPIPVALARQMSEDAILKVLLTKGVDVIAVAHAGCTIPAHLRSAIEVRDQKCIVPRCNARRNLQIDHRNTYGRTQITKLEDLGRLCKWHHYQKTFLGYTYRGGPGTWEWIPPDRDQDLGQLKKIITNARRC